MHHNVYLSNSNKFSHDNQSATRMDINGRNYCTDNSRYIDIIHLFIKYRVDKGDISIIYCPKHIMLAYYFTKPLQGALFNKF